VAADKHKSWHLYEDEEKDNKQAEKQFGRDEMLSTVTKKRTGSCAIEIFPKIMGRALDEVDTSKLKYE